MIRAIIVTTLVLCVAIVVAFNPSEAAGSYWWYTNQPSVVGVNPNTGELKAYSKGTAKICAQKSVKDPTIIQCFEVTVHSLGS